MQDSEIPGSQPVCGSPRLIAAYHVLHRLPSPRHPPFALSSLTIKFAPLKIPLSRDLKLSLFTAYLSCLDFFYPSLSDCQRSIPADAENQKFASEPLVSSTNPDSRDSNSINCCPSPAFFLNSYSKIISNTQKFQAADLLKVLIPASTEGHLQQERLD